MKPYSNSQQTPSRQISHLANYVAGYADATNNDSLQQAADWLDKLSRQICAQGYIGCYGGEKCTSDHK